MQKRLLAIGAGLLFALALSVGCQDAKTTTKDTTTPVAKGTTPQSKHAGWWCREHGIPEHECLMCLHEPNPEAVLKKMGDWCEMHERAKSQCFKCDPKLRDKYAAMYRAKYPGKEPPPIEDDEDDKDAKRDPAKKDGDKKEAGKKDGDK